MFKKVASFCGALLLLSFGSFADIHEIPGSFTRYFISFDGAEKISVTFDFTEEVDACNHHGLIGDLLPIADNFYLADLAVMSTEMYCSDRSTHTEVFSKTFEIPGSWMSILVPENAVITAQPVK